MYESFKMFGEAFGVKRVEGNKEASKKVRPLDPITVAGRVKLEKLVTPGKEEGRYSSEWQRTMWRVLVGQGIAATLVDKQEVREEQRSIHSHSRWKENLESLCQWKVLESCQQLESQIECKYFQVEKSETPPLDRAIFDCRQTNSRCSDPPPIQLVTVEELLNMFRRFVRPSCSTCDLRHWFYQIPLLRAEDRDLFCVHSHRRLRLRCLPMGFKWSPFLAQSVVWSVILKGVEDQVRGRTMERSPPPYVEIVVGGVTRGYIVVFYDNILVIGENKTIRDQWTAHIQRSLRSLDIAIKDEVQLSEKGAEFLGVEFVKTGDALLWRHKQSNAEKWAKTQLLDNIDSSLGILVWDTVVKNVSFRRRRGLIETLRARATNRQVEEWAMEEVENLWSELLKNDWVRWTTLEHPKELRILASDASNEGGAYLRLSERGEVAYDQRWKWSEEEASKYIAWRELDSALRAIEREIEVEGAMNMTIGIAIDNRVALAALKYFGCSEGVLDERLRQLEEITQRRRITIMTVWVMSEDEAADEPSRGLPINTERCRRCAQLVIEAAVRNRDSLKKRIRE